MSTTAFYFLLRGALVLVLVCVALFVARRASASTRRAILVWGFVAALAAPALSLLVAHTPVQKVAEFDASWARVAVDPVVETDAARATVVAGRATLSVPKPARFPMSSLAWGSWLAVAAIVLVRLGASHARVFRMIRASRELDGKLMEIVKRAERAASASARVRICPQASAPVATGVLVSHVLLPVEATRWSPGRLHTVLVHELTHVRQRDALAQLVAEITCAVQWWNPLAWWAKHRLERERELAADERVVASGMLPSEYATELLGIAAELDGVPALRAGVPVLGRSKLADRIERILSAERASLPGRWQRYALGFAACSLAALVACATPSVPEEHAPSASQTPSPRADQSSIDPAIQHVVDAESDRAKAEWSARVVTVVVLEPKTGKVIALANPALASTPRTAASTFKPLVVAAALEEGAIQPDDRFDCEQGRRTFPGGLVLRDAGSFGELSVTEILERSSNIGVSKIFDKLGGPALSRWFTRFHLSEPALDAAAGSLGKLDESSVGSMRGATIAIGVGAKLSPLHIASMYGAFANRGLYLAPSLERSASRQPERVLQASTAERVLVMLESAVENGTGKAARIDGVRVAGKTGTADLEDAGRGTHSAAYFAGIVPTDAPRWVIVVVVEDPKDAASGGRVAAPLFARIASQIL